MYNTKQQTLNAKLEFVDQQPEPVVCAMCFRVQWVCDWLKEFIHVEATEDA